MNDEAARSELAPAPRPDGRTELAAVLYPVAVGAALVTPFAALAIRDTALAIPYLWGTRVLGVCVWLGLLGLAVEIVGRAPSNARRIARGVVAAVLLVALAALDVGSTVMLDFGLFWQF